MTLALCAVALAIAAFGAAPGAAPTPSAPPRPSGLLAAIQAGEALVVARGAGAAAGDSLQLEVINQSAETRAWILPMATRAESADAGVSDMLIRRLKGRTVDASRYVETEAIELKAGESASYLAEAYTLDFRKRTPAPATALELKAPLPLWRRLMSEADRVQPTTRALQAAVWMLSGKISRGDLDKTFPVSAADYATAVGLASTVQTVVDSDNIEQESESKSASAPGGTGGWPLAAGAALTDFPAPDAMEAKPGPPLSLHGGNPKIQMTDGKAHLSIPLLYEWTIPGPSRPRHYVACMRFFSGQSATDVAASGMRFDGDSGQYEAAVEQGALKGAGVMVYAVFRDLTIAADQAALNALFDQPRKGDLLRISSVLRFAVDWEKRTARLLEPLESISADLLTGADDEPSSATRAADTASSATVEQSAPDTGGQSDGSVGSAGSDRFNGGEARPVQPPLPSPVPTRPAATPYAGPVDLSLPLKNGGLLRGRLMGAESGQLLMELNGRPFRYDSAGLLHSPAQLLGEAKTAHQEGRYSAALQYAATAAALLGEGEARDEAESLVKKCRAEMAQ